MTRPREGDPADAEGIKSLDELRLTLRCGACATVFEVADTGERPLVCPCPTCGVEGVLERRLATFELVGRRPRPRDD